MSPLYQRVKDHVISRINTGEWAPGARVPSENELVESLGISRMTVNRALRELSEAGVIDRIAGVGSFVKEPQARASLMEIRNIADEISARGHHHSIRLIHGWPHPADAELAAAFELPEGARLYHLRLIHRENGLPVQLEDRFVDETVAPGFSQQDFTKQTPTAWLLNTIPVTELEHTVEAVMPSREEASLLQLETGEPCLSLKRRSWSNNRVVTFARFLYPASRYGLTSRHRTTPSGTLTDRNP